MYPDRGNLGSEILGLGFGYLLGMLYFLLISVSNEFTDMTFKSRAVGTIPPLRMNLFAHRYFARNNIDT